MRDPRWNELGQILRGWGCTENSDPDEIVDAARRLRRWHDFKNKSTEEQQAILERVLHHVASEAEEPH